VDITFSSWWCNVAVSRIVTAFMHHLNGGGIDCACAEGVWEEEKTPTFGWDGTHLGRIWQFMREHDLTISGPK
jgi:hypothetical protein